MIKWLQDTYNGLVRILIAPHLPSLAVIVALIIGVLVGLFWGYNLAPTVYYNGEPAALEQSWQNEWVKLLADRYAAPTNRDISPNIVELLQAVDDPVGIVDSLIASPDEAENVSKLQAIRPLAEQAGFNAAAAPNPSDGVANVGPWIAAPLALVVAATILIVLWGLLIKPIIVDPLIRQLRGQGTSKEVLAERKQRQEQAKLLNEMKSDFTEIAVTLGEPIMRRMTSYRAGSDYDESYEIEENEMFLGQCGAVISDAGEIGDGKVAAIEIWLFDKDDFVRTMTKVFVSNYALTDPAMSAQLRQKGELVPAQIGAIMIVETNSLRLQATVKELEYAVGAEPPNSVFQKLSVELAAWHVSGLAATPPPITPASTSMPISQAAPVQYAPAPVYTPPQQPSSFPTTLPPMAPPTQAPRPAQDPPPPPRGMPDDDPFGGTGDFTPIG